MSLIILNEEYGNPIKQQIYMNMERKAVKKNWNGNTQMLIHAKQCG